MICNELIKPGSIAVVGASNTITKPGGKLLKNLIDNAYSGNLWVVNPKEDDVQGIKSFRSVDELPNVELAILAIPARFCLEAVTVLSYKKNTKGFIIISAGFSEENEEGEIIEKQIVEVVRKVGGNLIGPNCIGLMNSYHTSVFTTPIPKLTPKGCDFISGSGATAVFIIESGIPKGLQFASVFSVGNSADLGWRIFCNTLMKLLTRNIVRWSNYYTLKTLKIPINYCSIRNH